MQSSNRNQGTNSELLAARHRSGVPFAIAISALIDLLFQSILQQREVTCAETPK